MSKFYVIGKASPELLKKMHADPSADRGAVMKSMCCLLYTSPSPRDRTRSRMPSSA